MIEPDQFDPNKITPSPDHLRKNKLSLIPGGVTLAINQPSGCTSYSRVKSVKAYLRAVKFNKSKKYFKQAPIRIQNPDGTWTKVSAMQYMGLSQ